MSRPSAVPVPPPAPRSPAAALAELHAGNHRFVTGTRVHPNQDAEHRAALAAAQTPFAVIFGCSDSRLAAEIVFDRGLGDLFVVRTAGHTSGPAVLGSIEYAVTVLATPLVVVLGHNGCGAVRAARDAVLTGVRPAGNLGAVVDPILPSVRQVGADGPVGDLAGDAVVDTIVDVHIRRTVQYLLGSSDVLAAGVEAGRCAIVGMSYQLSAGQVRVVAEAGAPSPRVSRLDAATAG